MSVIEWLMRRFWFWFCWSIDLVIKLSLSSPYPNPHRIDSDLVASTPTTEESSHDADSDNLTKREFRVSLLSCTCSMLNLLNIINQVSRKPVARCASTALRMMPTCQKSSRYSNKLRNLPHKRYLDPWACLLLGSMQWGDRARLPLGVAGAFRSGRWDSGESGDGEC